MAAPAARFVTIKQLAVTLDLSTSTIRRMVRTKKITQGVIHPRKFGFLRFDEEKVVAEFERKGLRK